jgi:molybdate transport repressor ModE-like protein
MSLSRYSLTSLQLFVAIAQSRSITAAAADFGLALSAASRRISDMESVAGSRLLHRSKNGVILTPAGRVLLKHATSITAALESLSNDMSDFSFGVEDRIRLWANTSAINGFLPAILENFHSHHPKMQIDLEEALSTDIVSAIHHGKADLGITSGNTPRLGLEAHICNRHSLVVILYPGHPLVAKKSLTFSDVLPYELVRSFDAICRLVASHLGIGILPEPAARDLATSLGLHIRPLKDAWATRELMLMLPETALSAAVCLLRDAIIDSAQNE